MIDACNTVRIVPPFVADVDSDEDKMLLFGIGDEGEKMYFFVLEEPFNLSPVGNFIGPAYQVSADDRSSRVRFQSTVPGRSSAGRAGRQCRGRTDRRRRYFIGFDTPQ